MKDIKIFHFKGPLPKCEETGLKTNHLATLIETWSDLLEFWRSSTTIEDVQVSAILFLYFCTRATFWTSARSIN
jgi:hypothetical protein